jgi:UDP-GlcNAc:undecaprenyl-phosphate GlcNAc-1-phosphate transferase
MPLEFALGLIAFGIASLMLPRLIRWARDRSLLDFPDDSRRRHQTPTPRIGGVAVFSAVVISCGLCMWLDTPAPELWMSVLIGASIVFVTGLIDDFRGLSPTVKLVSHGIAAFAVMAQGFQVDSLTLGGGREFVVGLVGIPLTLVWVVGMTNAFNLIDGVDGLASSFALIGLITAVVVQAWLDPTGSFAIAATSIGALLAFLRYNRAPARIFLGDCGSTTIGFVLSILLVQSATDSRDRLFVAVPLFALAYPLADTGLAIVRRWLRGHPFSRADGRHIHHQILALGASPRRTVDLLGTAFLALAVWGIALSFTPPRVTFAIATAGSILLFSLAMYALPYLGYHEFSELATSVVSVLRNGRRHVRNKIRASDLARRVARARNVEELSQMLGESAAEFGLLDVTLEVIGPTGAMNGQRGQQTDRPLRVDCPISVAQSDGRVDEVTLRFWCERPNAYRHVGVERLAMHLAPAVQQWFEANGGSPESRRWTSGGHLQVPFRTSGVESAV